MKGLPTAMLSTSSLNRPPFRYPNLRWIVCAIIFIWLFATCTHDRRRNATLLSSHWTQPLGHPIERLISEKQQYFNDLVVRQSRTLPDAILEYKRRYHRNPPTGFNWWFELAKKHNFQLIDEFDTFMDSMEPYRGISPYVLQKRMDMVQDLGSGRLGILTIQDGEVDVVDQSHLLDIRFLPNTTDLAQIPYNLTILLNGLDEPAVVAHYEEYQDALLAASKSEYIEATDSEADFLVQPLLDSGRQPGWSAQAQACSYQSPSRKAFCPRLSRNAPFSFQSNIAAENDVCQNCHLLHQHGMLLRPETMQTARQLVPIFSASRPSHFHDLLYPSLFYDGTREQYEEALDPNFHEKDNKFYWAGKATGGQVTQENWFLMQRQRLVLKCREQNIESVQVLQETRPDTWSPAWTSMADIARRFFKVHISGVVQCQDTATCDEQKVEFGLVGNTENLDDREKAYKYKFLLDIDGNGFSGRFYRLLRSKSVVVKQTILKEWHDDRLVPWVHYVPLSTGYDELPELARFLAGTDKGLQLSERIALESTEWHDMALRDVDLQLYTIRIFLEFGRLMSGEP